jgi:hypothetical protein
MRKEGKSVLQAIPLGAKVNVRIPIEALRIGKIKALPKPLAGGSGAFEPGNGLPGVGVWLLDWGFAWNAGDQRWISD